ncbi:MAG: M28 family peptidase [Ignavibacteriae bacterium]|nr:M28 family peptidase [Ignavibacteriota bacterium]
MKKYLLFLIIALFPSAVFSQIIYSHKIDSVINLMSNQAMGKYVRELSGDTVIAINNAPYRIYSRHANSPANQMAAQYILEKFQSFGIPARLQYNNAHNVNVIARKTGYENPNLKIIIGAHYDNIRSGLGPLDTMKGSDDNGSGVAAVLEAARLLANYNSKFTIEFIAFDEEEIGLLGAYGYADSCYHDTSSWVLGVFNMDMIAWDGNNDGLIRIMTSQGCDFLADMLIRSYQLYNINLTPIKAFNAAGSDHLAFWSYGIGAITSIEPVGDFNPYYHSLGDIFGVFNMNFFRNNARANLAAVLSLANELIYSINHQPLASTSLTTERIADAGIVFGVPVASGANAPRLYYKVGSGPYQFVNAFEITGQLYRFKIPGQPAGSQISYYIAAQDSSGAYYVSYPAGASGVNPPGIVPPPQVLTYYVYSNASFSSNHQKPVLDNQYTYDTIYIPNAGNVQDVKVNLNINHSNDGDILISLIKGGVIVNLSQFNGNNGQNYTNTTFHDTADMSISQGTPPFTGWFRPQQAFTGFNNVQMQGNWILRIFDIRTGNTGTLLNWNLSIKYSSPISVKKEENIIPEKYSLYQNYPNPFNPVTTIKYSLPEKTFVTLKIYDMLGKEIKTLVSEMQTAGLYSAVWDASALPSGAYFCRLQTNTFSEVKKMMLIK